MSNDHFADLLAGVTKRKDDSKLSMAERQKSSTPSSLSRNGGSSSQWGDFDILAKSSSNSQSGSLFEGFDSLNSTTAPQRAQTTFHQPQPTPQEHLFEGFGNSATSTPPLKSPQQSQNSSTSNIDLLDDFDFGASSGQAANPLNSTLQPHPQRPQQSQQQSLDDLFAVFDAPVQQPATPNPTPVTAPRTSSSQSIPSRPARSDHSSSISSQHTTPKPVNNNAFDESVAAIVDMGFSAEQAVRALQHTRDGLNVQEAINFIMTEAHNKTRAKAGLPPQDMRSSPSTGTQRRGNGSEAYIQGFSKLMSGVTKKVMKEAQQFMAQPSTPSDGRPAWMRDAEKYKRRTPEYEEDPEPITTDELNKLHLDDRPQPPRPRKQSISKPMPLERPQHPVPAPPLSKQTPEPEVDLFSPMPSKATQAAPEPEVDLFSSPKPTSSSDQMMTSSKRRAARPTKPSHTTTPKVTRPTPSISSTQMEFFEDSREQGGITFKNGDFTTALTHYQTALSALPQGHVLQILAMSNVITCLLKVGENRKAIDMSTEALDLIGKDKGVGEEIEGKSMKDFWIKIMSKKAEALEHLEKHSDSLEAWKSVIDNGGASKQALDAKRRLMDVVNPTKKKSAPVKKATPPPSSSKPEPVKTYEAVDRVKREHQKQEAEEAEKFKLHDVVEDKLNAWKQGKEDNLRALISSLDTVLWDGANWKPVSMGELVVPKKVKLSYMKAVAKTHPDKVPVTATSEQKMIAQGVFVTLNTAWETFKSQNGLS